MSKVNVAIIGGGTVGGGVYRAISENGDLMASRCGSELRVNHVVVRNPRKRRAVKMSASLISTDWKAAIEDPATDIVVELVGGTDTAFEIVELALKNGKPVITANKALLSEKGSKIFRLVKKYQTQIYFEASVAGGIPIIKVLRESMVGNRIQEIYAIANGTCNYILTKMAQEERDFDEVLKEAQDLGYAEAEPSLDVDGYDAMHKVGIMASIISGFWIPEKSIFVKGIRDISPIDLQFADWLGYTIKLIGKIRVIEDPKAGKQGWRHPKVECSVEPTLVPKDHVLSSVDGVFNAVFVKGDIVGETLYYGQGAGQDATASSVVSDLVDAAVDLAAGGQCNRGQFAPFAASGEVINHEETINNYFIRLEAVNKAGTMARVTDILAKNKIGISSCIQPENHDGDTVPLMLMVDGAPFSVFKKAMAQLARLSVVKAKPVYFRVESFQA